MQSEFKDVILHWGMRRLEVLLLDLLASCDVALVTAHHDFYGISVLSQLHSGWRWWRRVNWPTEITFPRTGSTTARTWKTPLSQP